MSIERIRGRKLQEQRLRIWLASPCCARCGIITIFPGGFQLDHIIALTNDGTNDDSNMQVLCDPCHDVKTNEDLGYTPKVAVGLDGWPIETAPERSRTARWKRAARG